MSNRWKHDLGDDLVELCDGTVRIAYDADTQIYTWQRPDGVKLQGPEYGPLTVVQQWRPPPPPPRGTPWPCSCCGEDKNARPSWCECGGGECPVKKYDIPCVKCAKHCDAAWHRMKPGEPLNITTPYYTRPAAAEQPLPSGPAATTFDGLVGRGIVPRSAIASASRDDMKKPKGRLLTLLTGLFKQKG
ncbi:hypothetical protein BR93DRAFT_963276 [Coniochaeta sp. PMI_546]|nr:hypothetical protein BR93DRAFT_963276 [Coniochaeta sp. PMI_546]